MERPGLMRSAVLVLGLVVLVGCARVRPHYLVPSVEIGEPAFFPSVAANTRAPIVDGNHVEILLNGDDLFPALFAAIRSARYTITFLQYYYDSGDIPRQVAEALAGRCRAGVGVNVLLDASGDLARDVA